MSLRNIQPPSAFGEFGLTAEESGPEPLMASDPAASAERGASRASAKNTPPAPHVRGLPPTLRQILEHPDYAAVHADPLFFYQGPACLHSPLLIPGMETAVEILKRVLDAAGHIVVLGDRDVDGVSSAALLGNFLRARMSAAAKAEPAAAANQGAARPVGGTLDLRVSDDGDDYGLSGDLFQNILSGPADLVILLDMGTSNGPEVEQLIDRGKSVIILDHHMLHDRIPDPALPNLAFANPMRDEAIVCALEHSGKIATVGLVFKLLMAYGLSCTNEWQRVFYTQSSGGALLAYRCGRYLGAFRNLEEGRAAYPQWSWHDLRAEYRFAPEELAVLDQASQNHSIKSESDADLAENWALTAGKLVLAATVRSRPRLLDFVQRSADLAAVGIITDMVPLLGENRALVRLGIGQSGFPRRGERPYSTGYGALIAALGLPVDRVVSRDLGWSIGPSLNAAGRMGNTKLALDLLTCGAGPEAEQEAKKLARDLVRVNDERKKRTARNDTLVARHFAEHPELLEQPIVFCYHPDLEPGVSGIVATRLVERYNKPVVYIHPEGTKARGSARTYGGLNVLKLLDAAAEYFIQFGGHPEAAGFSIETDQIAGLERALLAAAPAVIAEHSEPGDANRTPEFHMELRPAALGYELLREIELLEPFGSGIPEPVFRLPGVKPTKIKYMSEGKHARFALRGAPAYLDCVAWRLGPEIAAAEAQGQALDIYGSLEMSYFAGRSRLQLRIDRLHAVVV